MEPAVNPLLGRIAFERSCAGCHASQDGFDLRTFGFTQTTIVRRAVHHVDSVTARDIAAHIRTIPGRVHDEKTPLFQPGVAAVENDVEFSMALFGQDGWPSELTSAQLATIDPRSVEVAIRLPVWSDESSNMDWMPDAPLPTTVLEFSGGAAASAMEAYRATPTRGTWHAPSRP